MGDEEIANCSMSTNQWEHLFFFPRAFKRILKIKEETFVYQK